MAYLNRVFLIGNLTRDPELRVTPKGTSICQFGFAVNRQGKDDAGNATSETTFLDIEAWGKQADLVAKYLTKGAPAMIEGRLKLDQWEDKQSGQKRSKLKVVLENVQFLGSRSREDSTTPAEQQGQQSRNTGDTTQDSGSAPQPAKSQGNGQGENIDEDVPF